MWIAQMRKQLFQVIDIVRQLPPPEIMGLIALFYGRDHFLERDFGAKAAILMLVAEILAHRHTELAQGSSDHRRAAARRAENDHGLFGIGICRAQNPEYVVSHVSPSAASSDTAAKPSSPANLVT